MNSTVILTVIAIAIATLLVNIPLGKLRVRERRLSLRWFVYIHLSVPLIFALRHATDTGHWAVPFFVVAALVGQIIGGKGGSDGWMA